MAGSASDLKQTANAGSVTGYDIRLQLGRDLRDYGIHHVAGACSSQQLAGGVCAALRQAHNFAAAEHPPKLHLRWRPADLSDHHGGDHRDDSGLQPHPVLGPDTPLVTIRGD
jgi:hypothetical protein